MGIGERVRSRREQLGMSQLALAKEMDGARSAEEPRVSPMQVSRWERGETTPTVESCRQLAVALGCSLDWLINGTGAPPAEPLKATGTEG